MAVTILPLHNEGTTIYVTAEFRDKLGVLTAPTSARYRVDLECDGSEILEWTSIPAPLSTHEIEIDSTVQVMQDEALPEEVHVVTVEGTYGVGNDKVTDRYRFTLVNMYGI